MSSCLERKAGLDIHSCWFAFSLLLDFFYNFCFDFFKSLLGFCYNSTALKGRKGENRVRKLNVLLLRKKGWIGHSSLLVCFFFVVGFFMLFCFDFFKSLLGSVMILRLPRNTIFVKCVHPFLSL